MAECQLALVALLMECLEELEKSHRVEVRAFGLEIDPSDAIACLLRLLPRLLY